MYECRKRRNSTTRITWRHQPPLSMPEMKLLTSKKSWLLLQWTDHKSSCDVDPSWIKEDGCETAAITLSTAFSQDDVFGLVLKPEEFSSNNYAWLQHFSSDNWDNWRNTWKHKQHRLFKKNVVQVKYNVIAVAVQSRKYLQFQAKY
jgi:hypothetical protein